MTRTLIARAALGLLTVLLCGTRATQIALQAEASEGNDHQLLIRRFGDQIVKEWHIQGAIVALVEGNRTSTLSFGPVDEDTQWAIASNSKAFLAAAMGTLVQQGKVQWDDAVQMHLPEFRLRGRHGLAEPITVKDLLSHQTGLPRHDHAYGASWTLDNLLERVQYLRPSADLRQYWQYNNIAFMIASLIIEKNSGMSLASYVSEHIFEPLGMSSTLYAADTASAANLSQAFHVAQNGTAFEIPFWLEGHAHPDLLYPPGGIVSSAKDLAKWMRFLIQQRNSALKGEGLVWKDKTPTPKTVLDMSTGYAVVKGRSQDELSPIVYGLGLETMTYNGDEFCQHGGDLPGFQSTIAWIPSREIGVAVITNSYTKVNAVPQILAYHALDVLRDQVPVDWNTRFRKKLEDAYRAPRFIPSAPLSREAAKHLYGPYNDLGYGTITLCPSPQTAAFFNEACLALYKRIKGAAFTSEPQPEKIVLLIDFQRAFGVSHIAARHIGANHFRGSLANLQRPFGDRTIPLIEYEKIDEVEFRYEDGALLFENGIWGAGEIPDRSHIEAVFQKR